MLLFRSEGHIHRWCQTWNRSVGGTLSLQQAWGLARAWYAEDRRHPAWRRKTKEQAQAIFSGLGLTSPFWSL